MVNNINKLFFLFFLIFSLSSCNNDDSSVIEVLDGEKLTVKRFEEDYEVALETFSRQNNVEKKNLIDEILSKDFNELPRQLQQISFQFQKKNFYDNYRNMRMISIAADKSGFSTRKDIKQIVDYMRMQTIAQLYLQEEVEKKIKIDETQVRTECEELRKTRPEVAAKPLNDCITFARAKLKAEETEKLIPKVLERIKEGISIKHNEKFDLDEYLKSKKTSSTPTDTTPSKETTAPQK